MFRLLPGLSADDIRSGISQPRNQKLAEVFHRLHLIESYGTGIRRIYNLYAKCPAQPRIEVTLNTFKIVLPNMNAAADSDVPDTNGLAITTQMRNLLVYIGKDGQITEPEVQKLLGLQRTRAYTITKQMRDMNLITSIGRGVDKRFILPK